MMTREPVSAGDLRIAAAWAHETLAPAAAADWSTPAHNLEWSCRATLDHVLDCLAWYAHDLAGEITGMQGASRDGMASASIADLLVTIGPLAEVLALVATGKAPNARARHNWGVADPEGFLAMGTIETLLHTWDIGLGLGIDVGISPDIESIAGRVLARLFPASEPTGTAFDALLIAAGRLDGPDGGRVTKWQWHAAPVD